MKASLRKPVETRGAALNPQLPVEPEQGTDPPDVPPPLLIFAIVAIALFMSTVDSTIVATAFKAIHDSFGASLSWTGWTITIYSLGMVVALPVAGKISDQFGRRRIFVYGIGLFTMASVLCGLSTDIYMLVTFRAIQAIGGGAFTPSAAGLVSDHFGKNRDRAIGMFGTIAASGMVAGPIFGGLLVGYLSWRWIFFVNVPIGIVLVCSVIRVIPESRLRLTATTKTDVLGLALLASFVLASIIGITNLGAKRTAIFDPSVVIPELCALGFLWGFARHTTRASSPFIPMRLLRGPGFAAANSENLLLGAVGFGVAALVPLYAEERYHLAALNAGTLLTARAIGMIAIGAITAFALRRTGYRLPMVVGLALVGVGILAIAVAPRWGASPYAWLSAGAGIVGLGTGAVSPASRNACLQLAPEDIAVITGLRQMFIYLGSIFSVSISTAVLNRSTSPGIAEAHILWVVAGLVFFVMVPLVFRIPDHKGFW